MTEANNQDYSDTLFLPKTDFPMRAGLPEREPEFIALWQSMNLYKNLRQQSKGRDKFILHDGPPYANGNIHIGTALNKVLKDLVVRSMQMLGYDSNYVPGWDCHGLPIEWKVEEQFRANGKDKDTIPINDFRQECREFAEHWIGVQREEFKRLGIEGDWENPYLTMAFEAEAIIANELMKHSMSGQLYRGSKPVMWSVVERTALAEAEVEYQDYESDTIWTKFPIISHAADSQSNDLTAAAIVIWTTTPWTIPGNRAISYSDQITYGLYEVTEVPEENWAKAGEKLLVAESLVDEVMEKSRVTTFKQLRQVKNSELADIICAHPLANLELGGYQFSVPMLVGDHVTADAGTGFVHSAPGHGAEDFEVWVEHRNSIESKGIDSQIPFTVADDGYFTEDAPGFEGHQVITDKGKKGSANQAVIDMLVKAGQLIARGRVKHQYPHSWRSKKPIIFRNTPQWFVYMDKPIEDANDTLRTRALKAIAETRFVPASGQNRLRSMIENRPDWVLSRQRAWGVPITVFVNAETNEVLKDEKVNQRIFEAFKTEGADAWFATDAKERFLGNDYSLTEWEKVDDILDVWFDSGSTHAFCLEQREDLKPSRKGLGGKDYVLYLEGSDQHRGWFHSSLLQSCGTRKHAPYDAVLTHGFTMDEKGRKMSKSLGNQTFPQDVIKQYGADILRLWVASSDYAEDQRIGQEILKTNVDAYRKLRNTIRWMLGSLTHYKNESVPYNKMPELERLMLHRLFELDLIIRKSYEEFDFKKVFAQLFNFLTVELSAFYFDIRKDALYCDAPSSVRRKAALEVIDHLFNFVTAWLAPILVFTMEETWQSRFGDKQSSVHLREFPKAQSQWQNDELAKKWNKIKDVRKVINGALEIERQEKRIGSSLEAHPTVYISEPELVPILEEANMADIAITSQLTISVDDAPNNAFKLDEVSNVAVVSKLAQGNKCARCWKILSEVGTDPQFPDLSLRDAEAMRELSQ